MKNLHPFIKYQDPSAKKSASWINKILLSFTGIMIFILLWVIVGRLIIATPRFRNFYGFLPLPALKSLLNLFFKRIFWFSVFKSLLRITIGLFIATLIGIPSGLIIGFYRYIKTLTNIPIQFLRMISPLAWMPIAIIIFPGFEQAIIFLIAIASVWPILLNTSQGVNQVDSQWIRMAQNQGANDYQMLFRVILPASLPYILNGFRLAIGVAWVVLVPAEFLGVTSGLGYLINDARDTMEYGTLMALVIAIGLLGYLIDGFFSIIKRHFDWQLK